LGSGFRRRLTRRRRFGGQGAPRRCGLVQWRRCRRGRLGQARLQPRGEHAQRLDRRQRERTRLGDAGEVAGAERLRGLVVAHLEADLQLVTAAGHAHRQLARDAGRDRLRVEHDQLDLERSRVGVHVERRRRTALDRECDARGQWWRLRLRANRDRPAHEPSQGNVTSARAAKA
jgi:hypothetical protein